MKKQFERLLHEAAGIESVGDRQRAALSLFRLLIQHACFSVAEWVATYSSPDLYPDVSGLLANLRKPTDGTVVDTLESLLIVADNVGWTGVAASLWRAIEGDRPAKRLLGESGANLLRLLNAAVTRRNEGAEGHGIVGGDDPEALLDLVLLAVEAMAECLPSEEDGGSLYVQSSDGRSAKMRLLRTIGGDMLCLRSVASISNGKCRVSAQRRISFSEREDVRFEADDVLLRPRVDRDPEYTIPATADPDWNPLVLLPDRLADPFLGRQAELQRLSEWLADGESLACQVFGDGGIGKTTLILEFLHRVLEQPTECPAEQRPEVISYFTAKQTRWGLNGLEPTGPVRVAVVDVARRIVRSWDGVPLGKEWLMEEPEPLIDRLGTYIKDRFGIDKRKHLLVLDNTETLASSDDEVQRLGSYLTRFTRRVGRVLITSRRREDVEARSIEVQPLSESESVRFLRARADALGIQSLRTAGDRLLSKAAEELGRKPLVLEVFVQTSAGEPGIGTQSALDRVLRMQHQDLGEFLYADAWKRLRDDTKYLVLLMSRVGDVLDEALVKLCCLETNVSVMRAYEALEASRGIATITVISGIRQVVFHPDFLRFCAERNVKVSGREYPSMENVERVRRRYSEFLDARSRQVVDRVSTAFRKPFARLAYRAYEENNIGECETYYELAVAEDPGNASLFDRYAMFLFKTKQLDAALGKAIRGTQIDPVQPEAWFTRGLIEARLSKTDDALQSLMRAKAYGKEPHLVMVQAAWAHVNARPPNEARARQAVQEATHVTPKGNSWFLLEHGRELRRLRRRLGMPGPLSHGGFP